MAVAKRQSNSEYHADRSAISRSQIADFIADPTDYRDRYVLGNGGSESSDVLDFGNLFHASLLAPDELADFVEVPAWALNGSGKKKGRAFGSFARQHPGKTFVTGQEIVLARRMADAAMQFGHEHLAQTGYAELSIYWECPHTGLQKKTKPDWFYAVDGDGELVVIDYKSTESHDRFPSHFRRFRYWLQHPHYCEGIQALTGVWPSRFIYAAVDKSDKPRYQEHELWPASQEKARDAYIRACERLAESLKTDVWEQPTPKVQMLTLRDSDL